MKHPLDIFPYCRDPRSRPIHADIGEGVYVFVRDENGTIFVVPDGLHLHPKVLGGGEPAMYAGDMTIWSGKVKDLTNLSGTFQFSDAQGLLDVAKALEEIGLEIMPDAVRLFSYTERTKPRILR